MSLDLSENHTQEGTGRSGRAVNSCRVVTGQPARPHHCPNSPRLPETEAMATGGFRTEACAMQRCECVCVCACACVCMCMWRVSVCACAPMCMCVCVCVHVCVSTHVRAYMCMYVGVYVCMCACASMCMCVCTRAVCVRACVRVCAHMCVCVVGTGERVVGDTGCPGTLLLSQQLILPHVR